MKIFNPLASGKASGRALGGVFSSNRGMETFKKYVKTYQPNTAEQQDVKTRFAYLTKYWKTSLTYEQITLWNNWVLPWTDIYGDTVLLTGINKFVICNDTLLRAGKPITPTPPTETPSEITFSTLNTKDMLIMSIDGISNAEITAQDSFLQIEVIGELQFLNYIVGYLVIKSTGGKISRRPLEKNYHKVYWHNCRTGLEGITEIEIQIYKDLSVPSLQSLRVQRYNKFGYWSGKAIYTDAVTILNLIINGHFNSDTVWIKGSEWTIHDGKAFVELYSNLTQTNLPLVSGHNYRLELDAIRTSAGGEMYARWGSDINIFQITDTGHYSGDFTFSGANNQIKISDIGSWSGSIDNMLLHEI